MTYRGRISRPPGVISGGRMIGILAPVCGGSSLMPGSMLDGGSITSRSPEPFIAIDGPMIAAAVCQGSFGELSAPAALAPAEATRAPDKARA
jgi:hypothetical protein